VRQNLLFCILIIALFTGGIYFVMPEKSLAQSQNITVSAIVFESITAKDIEGEVLVQTNSKMGYWLVTQQELTFVTVRF